MNSWRKFSFFFVALLFGVVASVGCDSNKEGQTTKTSELYQSEFSSVDPLVALSAVNLYDRLLCASQQGNAGNGTATPTKDGIDTGALINLQKKMLTSKFEWKRLQALQSLIVCKAEGLNAIVIERFRLETDPDVKQHLVEIVAMYGNLPLQREIASRAIRSRDLETQRTAYNLILEPYYASQLKVSDPVRHDAVIERLRSGIDLSNPLISAKNLRNLLALGDTKQSTELIDLVENHDASLERRLNALTTLALVGDVQAAPLFKAIIAAGGFEGAPGGRGRRGRGGVPSARAVQFAKLGQIASGERSLAQVDSLLPARDKNTPFYVVEVLLSNGSPEALDKLVKYYLEAPPAVQHYIVSALYGDDRKWTVQQLAALLDHVNDTDRLLIDKYLVHKGVPFRNEVFAEALKLGSKEQIPRLLRFIRHKMDTPTEIERFASLSTALKALEQNNSLPGEVKEESRFILFLLDLVKEKNLPDMAKIDAMSFDDKFQTLLIAAQLGLLSDQELELLQKSDNSFLRLVGSTYLRNK